MSSVLAAGTATGIQTQSLGVLPREQQLQEQPLELTSASDYREKSNDGATSSTLAETSGHVEGAEKGADAAAAAAETELAGGMLGGGGEAEHVEGTDQERDQGMSMSSDDTGQWTDEDSHELKRVKVYELVGSRWVDQGTAFCFGDFQDNEALLIARAEADFNHVILSTTIRSNDVYQRQQDTLIVWTEPDGVDYALSFQDPEGCAEVWHFIQEVQRHMNAREDPGMSSSPMIGPEPSITTASIIRSGHLPQPQLGIIAEVERAIKTLARTHAIKERICEYIQSENYIKAMIDVMHQAEDLESIENLHALCSCIQAILMLNDHSLYEYILEDDIFFGVVGMLEYDPEFPTYKANYRDFLRQTSRFHQPIPLRDATIQKKVHHTYRLQFLKDVVLARAIDDSTFNVLNSAIIFNQIDIINYVQSEPAFLAEVVGIFINDDDAPDSTPTEPSKDMDTMDVDQSDPTANGVGRTNGTAAEGSKRVRLTPEEQLTRRREVVFLVQQLCVMGKNIQLPARMSLFRSLDERGILFIVQWALGQPETDEHGRQMIAAAGEILTTVLDHDLLGVRHHVMKQVNAMESEKASGKNIDDRETFLALMCRIMVKSRDLAVQSQIGEALKTLMEVQPDPAEAQPVGMKVLQRPKDDPVVERFLDYFYKHCIDSLFRPFWDIPEFKYTNDSRMTMSRERANLFLYLCDLLSTFTLQHSFRSHFYIQSSNIAPRVASLLSAKDKHLRLAAFRFFRSCLKLNNINIFKHLIKHDLFDPILHLTSLESRRDNLLSASCQEFFEHMRKENMKELIAHCMSRHGARIRQLADTPLGGPRFQNLIRRWEMNEAPPPPEEEKAEKPTPNGSRKWGQGRLMETEEEDYWNRDDDEEDPITPVPSSPPPRGNAQVLKRKRARGMSERISRAQRNVPSQPLSALVAYDDGDDQAEETEDAVNPALSPSIPHRTASGNSYFTLTSSDDPPPSPRMRHKQIPLKPTPSQPAPDSEDDLLETLFNNSRPSSPGAGKAPDLGAGAKRRRDDDDDELLERLASRSKRASFSPSPAEKDRADSPLAAKAGPAKPAEEGPKKIKLKFGPVGAAVAASPTASSPAVSDPGTKEGDNG